MPRLQEIKAHINMHTVRMSSDDDDESSRWLPITHPALSAFVYERKMPEASWRAQTPVRLVLA